MPSKPVTHPKELLNPLSARYLPICKYQYIFLVAARGIDTRKK